MTDPDEAPQHPWPTPGPEVEWWRTEATSTSPAASTASDPTTTDPTTTDPTTTDPTSSDRTSTPGPDAGPTTPDADSPTTGAPDPGAGPTPPRPPYALPPKVRAAPVGRRNPLPRDFDADVVPDFGDPQSSGPVADDSFTPDSVGPGAFTPDGLRTDTGPREPDTGPTERLTPSPPPPPLPGLRRPAFPAHRPLPSSSTSPSSLPSPLPDGAVPPQRVPTRLSEPAGRATRTVRPRKEPKRPWFALPALVLIGLLATFFSWVSAEPFWLATGRGATGTATVIAGDANNCRVNFRADDGSFVVPSARLAGAGRACASGLTMPARMLSSDAGHAYATDQAGLNVRWGAGLGLLLVCAVAIVWVTGALRFRGWRRAVSITASLAAPLLLAIPPIMILGS